jgi:glyoxylase I family protein
MEIEHFAYLVAEPVEAARWYVEQLGMKVVRESGPPSLTRFLADTSGKVMLEIYKNDKLGVPDYRSFDPLVIHVAFAVDDPDRIRAQLLDAGAAPEGEATTSPLGDRLVMMRDPWGFPIQFVRRKEPMVPSARP